MSDFSELIKNFDKIRRYMTEFYVYGYKTRSDFAVGKSLRSYDDEKRRIESYLSEFTYSKNAEDGKSVYITVDSSIVPFNPLYETFKAKSFTKNDITLHFYILDILFMSKCLTATEITNIIAKEYSVFFKNALQFDIATIRLKLNEYTQIGLIKGEKRDGKIYYSLKNDFVIADNLNELLHFYSETAPVGVIGSFLIDGLFGDNMKTCMQFKHHHFQDAIDSEIVLSLLIAIKNKAVINIKFSGREKENEQSAFVLPLKILVSIQTGRQYLAAYHLKSKRLNNYRIDRISSIDEKNNSKIIVPERIDALNFELNTKLKNCWNVSYNNAEDLHYLEMIVRVEHGEEYILTRLNREGRNGIVERYGENLYRYSIELYDAWEIMTWIRTFIGRIESFFSTDKTVTKIFNEDIESMKLMYGGDDDDI